MLGGLLMVGSPAATAAPTLSGTAGAGDALTASPGTWSPAASSYAYQWQLSTNGGSTWTAITGATSSSYTLPAADQGDSVRVIVTATNTYGSASADSAAAKIAA